MKVVLSHRSLYHEGLGGGISRMYNELSTYLSELGCEVTLVTGKDDFDVDWAKVVSLKTLDKEDYRRRLASFLSSYEFDILECSSLDAEALEYLDIPDRKPVIVRADVSGQDFSGQSDDKEQRLMKGAEAVISISYAVQQYFSNNNGINSPYVIWNGVDISKFPFYEHTANKSIVWLGRPTHAKGFDLLPKVFETLKDYHFDLLMGATPEPVHFQQSNVTVHPNLAGDKLNEVLRKCSFVLFTARFEPFGLSALEGMAAGIVPVVPFNSGGLNEFVIDNYNGIVYDSIGELPTLLARINYTDLVKHAHQTALDFSSRRCALETFAVYQQVLSLR